MAASIGARRAQLVLLAAAVVAIALIPVLFAYLQLGVHPDVEASRSYDNPTDAAVHVIERAVHRSGASVAGTYAWRQRESAASTTRLRLDPALERLKTQRIDEGIVHRTTYNQTLARQWARRNCPRGPDRRFGACEAHDGVVVQNRAGETHVLMVAVDLRTTTHRGTTTVALPVRTVGGVAPPAWARSGP